MGEANATDRPSLQSPSDVLRARLSYEELSERRIFEVTIHGSRKLRLACNGFRAVSAIQLSLGSIQTPSGGRLWERAGRCIPQMVT